MNLLINNTIMLRTQITAYILLVHSASASEEIFLITQNTIFLLALGIY